MHHRPSGPPLSARTTGALTRWSLLVRAALRRTVPARLGRLAFGALVTTTVVGLVLAIPVVSGSGAESPAVELDSSSTSSAARYRQLAGGDGPRRATGDHVGEPPPPRRRRLRTTGSRRTPDSSGSEDPAAPGSSSAGCARRVTRRFAVRSPSTAGTTAPGSTTTGSPSSPSSPAAPGTTPGSTPAGPTEPTTAEPDDASAPPPAPAVLDPASEVLALLNAERAAQGCGALVADDGLASAAQAHSAAMSASGVLGLDGLEFRRGRGRPGPAERALRRRGLAGGPGRQRGRSWTAARTSVGIAVVDGWWTTLLA